MPWVAGAKPLPRLPSGCRGDVTWARRGDLGGGTVPAPCWEVLIHSTELPAEEGNTALAPGRRMLTAGPAPRHSRLSSR